MVGGWREGAKGRYTDNDAIDLSERGILKNNEMQTQEFKHKELSDHIMKVYSVYTSVGPRDTIVFSATLNLCV